MEKSRQKELLCWLRQQSVFASPWINISRLLGMFSSLLIISQTWLLAYILYYMTIENTPCNVLVLHFFLLVLVFFFRASMIWLRERIGFYIGRDIRYEIRRQVLDRLQRVGPMCIQENPTGSWITLILEQIDDMHDYYARYLPQITLAIFTPTVIIIAIFLINWIAALILMFTVPLIPMFISIVGMNAADANRRNFQALARLSSYFLDRIRGMETLRLFGHSELETKNIVKTSNDFRKRNMEVLRLAFLSSGVLEFFSSLSIALVAVYFGFSYLGKLNFGHYNTSLTLLSGFSALMLAPEFFQPLRDLGNLYHSRAKAIGAADKLEDFLKKSFPYIKYGNVILKDCKSVTIDAKNLCILSPKGKMLAGPLNFSLLAGKRVVLIGRSGSGKSLLLNTLSGFLPYSGSLQVNGQELRKLDLKAWHKMLSWVGQNPHLTAPILRNNVSMINASIEESRLNSVLNQTLVSEFLHLLPHGLDTVIGDNGFGLSVGQIQKVAIARALFHPCKLLLLDEPTANLDIYSEKHIMKTLNDVSLIQSTLMITYQLDSIVKWDSIWVMEKGLIVEQGDYSSLYKKRGFFFQLISSYLGEKI